MALTIAEKPVFKPHIHLKDNHLRHTTSSPVIAKSPIKTQKELNLRQPKKHKEKLLTSPPPLKLKPCSESNLQEQNQNTNTDSSPSSSDDNKVSDVLRLMDLFQFPLDEELYLDLIIECTESRDAIQGSILHAHIVNSHKETPSLLIMNRLILMHASCGEIKTALKVFAEMPVRNTVSWATIIAAYSECPDGYYKALKLFVKMNAEPIEEKYYSHAIIAALRSCIRVGNLEFGLQIHALMVKKLGLRNSLSGELGSSLLQFYNYFGLHDTAHQVFDKMRSSSENIIKDSSWCTIVTVCNREGRFKEAINLFIEMVKSGKRRNDNSLSSALTACAEIKDNGFTGRQIHADAIKNGFGSERFVVTGLVHMYANNGLAREAARCFQGIDFPDLVCWNSILVSYARNGHFEEAVKVLYAMKAYGIMPSQDMIDEVKMACNINCN